MTPVDQAVPEPGGQCCRVPELIAAAPGAHDRLLGTVLRLVRVTDQAGREPDEPGQLRHQLVGERVRGGAVTWSLYGRILVQRQGSQPFVQSVARLVLTPSGAYSGQKPPIPVASGTAATSQTA